MRSFLGDPLHATRRSSVALLSALTTLLLVPSPASAEARATVTSPGQNAVVSDPVDLTVTVTRELLDPEVRTVALRLSADGANRAAGTKTVVLSCVSGCGSERSTWSGPAFVPATAAPFASESVCNGRWHLQPSVDSGPFTSGTTVSVAVAPSPARAVSSSTRGTDEITVRWEAAPEPDVAAYRVERRVDGGSWRTVATVDAGQTSLTRRGLAPGRYEHRVVTLRPDGFIDGTPAPPCGDQQHDLAATSATTSATLGRSSSPSPSPGSTSSPRPSSSPGPSTGGNGGDGDQTGGDPSGEPGDGSSPDPSASPSDGSGAPGDGPSPGATRRGEAPRIGAPPSARREGPRLSAPSLPSQPGSRQEDVYFGEDGPFSEELDYGDAEGIRDEDPGSRSVTQRVVGGVEVFTERLVDPERILRPIAGGLIALTLGLHLRRWQRDER